MASSLVIPNTALPVITATALGPYRNPTAVMGFTFSQAIDNLGFYIGNIVANGTGLAVTATSTSTQNGAAQTNNSYRGGNFFVEFTSVVATCTVRINVQAIDPNGYFFTIASLSIDNVSTGSGSVGAPHASNSLLVVYPGATTSNPAGTVSQPLSASFRTQASITVINTTSTSAVAFTLAYNLQL